MSGSLSVAENWVRRAAETSTAVKIATFFLYSKAPPEERSVDDAPTEGRDGAIDDDQRSTHSDRPPAGTAESDGVVGGSRLYEAIDGGRRTLAHSVTYRLLAGPDEPRRVVIDLRKPALVTRSLRTAVRLYRTVRRVSPTSSAAGVIYRGSLRFREQPVRLVSITVLVLALLVLAGEAMAGSDPGPSTLVWIGVLIVAARGTQKSNSFEELAAVRWLRTRLATRGASSEDEGYGGDGNPER